eukprot:SAG25_NODE_279_length_10479_cov_3.241233_1_plen_90_part_00
MKFDLPHSRQRRRPLLALAMTPPVLRPGLLGPKQPAMSVPPPAGDGTTSTTTSTTTAAAAAAAAAHHHHHLSALLVMILAITIRMHMSY